MTVDTTSSILLWLQPILAECRTRLRWSTDINWIISVRMWFLTLKIVFLIYFIVDHQSYTSVLYIEKYIAVIQTVNTFYIATVNINTSPLKMFFSLLNSMLKFALSMYNGMMNAWLYKTWVVLIYPLFIMSQYSSGIYHT